MKGRRFRYMESCVRFLATNESKPSRERLTLIRIYEELRALCRMCGGDEVAPTQEEKNDIWNMTVVPSHKRQRKSHY